MIYYWFISPRFYDVAFRLTPSNECTSIDLHPLASLLCCHGNHHCQPWTLLPHHNSCLHPWSLFSHTNHDGNLYRTIVLITRFLPRIIFIKCRYKLGVSTNQTLLRLGHASQVQLPIIERAKIHAQ